MIKHEHRYISFEYPPARRPFNLATQIPKTYWPKIFLPTKNPKSKISNPQNPLIIPVTWNPHPPLLWYTLQLHKIPHAFNSQTYKGRGRQPPKVFWISERVKHHHLTFSVAARQFIPRAHLSPISMVTRYDVISSSWSSHIYGENTFFPLLSTIKIKSCGYARAKCLFIRCFHVKHKKIKKYFSQF